MQCACSGSTSGGIKVDRIYILYQAFKSQITKQKHPNAVIPVKLGEQTLDKEIVYSVTLFVAVYIIIVFVVALMLTAMGVDAIDAITGSAANMGNAGPGFGKVGSLGNYSSIPALGKFILSVEMLLGRMEIYSLLLIFVIFRRR
ncbi:MAG: trkH, partial [Bacteroidetes bacterium]|jgi:trk system potassium uptake protein TrkH|nr:trkH [Bacteroidota bacterium]